MANKNFHTGLLLLYVFFPILSIFIFLIFRSNQISECEFYLLENLDCCLIVYQPYRPLLLFIQDIGQEDQLLTVAWRIVNDSLRTDVSLLYPPYQVRNVKLIGMKIFYSHGLYRSSFLDRHRMLAYRMCHFTERIENVVC